jgi:ligand-binding sensor domain-containing protein
MNTKYYYWIILFISLTNFAQELNFKNFTQDDGLPSNEVYDIFQDKNGSMWFATDRGIAQYDGYDFKRYEPKNGLTDITVFDFYPQENGQVWCSTFNNKIFYFANGSSNFIAYKYNKVIENYIIRNKIAYFNIKNIVIDIKKTVFISTLDRVFTIDKNGKITEIQKSNNNKEINTFSATPRYIQSKKVNKNQNINYISTHKNSFYIPKQLSNLRALFSISDYLKIVVTGSMLSIIKKNGLKKEIHFSNKEPIEAGKFDAKHFWVGFRGKGIGIYDLNGCLTQQYLTKHSVTKIIKDSFGGLWISTLDSGVFYLKNNQIKESELGNIGINSLSSNQKETLYIATFTGDIYSKTESKSINLIHKGINNKPSYVQYSPKEAMGYFFSDNTFFNNSGYKNRLLGIQKISDDNSNTLALSQFSTYNLFSNKKYTSNTLNFRIHDISFVDNKLFIGTINGLKILEKGIIHTKNNPLFSYRIEDIDFEPRKRIFYMATLGKGVLIYDLEKEKVISIDKTKGLSNDLISEVYIENKNTVWACTNYGLNRIKFSKNGTYQIDYITMSNGLLSNQIKDIEILGNTVYVGTSKGLCYFSKSHFDSLFLKKKYFLRLESVVVNSLTKKSNSSLLKLNYNENQINFHIDAISFDCNKDLTYRYQLVGLDKNWRYTKEREILYEYIPPGKYTFIAQVMENTKILSEERISLPIFIATPFWWSWWFVSIIAISIGFIIYLFFRIRVLSYNKDIVRELLRILVKKIKRKEKYFSFREQGKEIRIKTDTILYVKSSGNYIEVVTLSKTFTIRNKIGDFIPKIPDPLEFLRIHRSYIIRIDKVEQKTKKSVFINNLELPVGETYLDELDKIIF